MTILPPLSAGLIVISGLLCRSFMVWYSLFVKFIFLDSLGLSNYLRNSFIMEFLYVSRKGSCPLGGSILSWDVILYGLCCGESGLLTVQLNYCLEMYLGLTMVCVLHCGESGTWAWFFYQTIICLQVFWRVMGWEWNLILQWVMWFDVWRVGYYSRWLFGCWASCTCDSYVSFCLITCNCYMAAAKGRRATWGKKI